MLVSKSVSGNSFNAFALQQSLRNYAPLQSIQHDKQIKRLCQIVIIFVSISFLNLFRGSKEISHSDGSFKYSQHMIGNYYRKFSFCNSFHA